MTLQTPPEVDSTSEADLRGDIFLLLPAEGFRPRGITQKTR